LVAVLFFLRQNGGATEARKEAVMENIHTENAWQAFRLIQQGRKQRLRSLEKTAARIDTLEREQAERLERLEAQQERIDRLQYPGKTMISTVPLLKWVGEFVAPEK
jgi:hypothetical protein